MMKYNKEEKELLTSLEKEEWKPINKGELADYTIAAKNHFKKDQRLSIRISEHDLKSMQKKAIQSQQDFLALKNKC